MRPGYLLSRYTLDLESEDNYMYMCMYMLQATVFIYLFLIFQGDDAFCRGILLEATFFFNYYLALSVQEAAARHSQRIKICLVRWRFLEPYQAVNRIGVNRRADEDARLGVSHASLEVATTTRSARVRNVCLTEKSPLPLHVAAEIG